MRRFLFDTSVFLYATGSDHPYRAPCRRILAEARDGGFAGEASVELVQEFLHVALRRRGDRREALELARAVADVCRLHDFEQRDLPLTMTLLAEHERLSPRDALFAATALNRGIDAVLSPDRDFDAIAGLERIDPADAAAVASLR